MLLGKIWSSIKRYCLRLVTSWQCQGGNLERHSWEIIHKIRIGTKKNHRKRTIVSSLRKLMTAAVRLAVAPEICVT